MEMLNLLSKSADLGSLIEYLGLEIIEVEF